MPAPILRLLPDGVGDNGQVATTAPSCSDVASEARRHFEETVRLCTSASTESFKDFEKGLWARMMALGRLLLTLFLTASEQRLRATLPARQEGADGSFERRPAQPRNINTLFGAIRYWRTYMRGPSNNSGQPRRGYHPLDILLGLTADRLSANLMSLATRLATKLSFAQTHLVLRLLLLEPPSTEVIEKSVLGLGRYTGQWFEQAPVAEGDGEILIIQFDGKAAPTATPQELERRRKKRGPAAKSGSKRHRNRRRRGRHPSKPRRQPGDKSKNGRVVTVVIMYSLKIGPEGLEGPINRWTYASFGPKRHAFEVARRQAKKRGFSPEDHKQIQIVTDGDEDLARYAEEYFPEAIHTIDIIHVIEYLWDAARAVFSKNDADLRSWIDEQKGKLYDGQIDALIEELERQHERIPLRGPGTKSKRETLAKTIRYITKRREKMDYKTLLEMDLEISSGAIEGAVKYVVAQRFDQGGMRWIPERAQALLHLRCIELNDDWDSFFSWVHDQQQQRAQATNRIERLQRKEAIPLPKLREAA